MWLHVINFVLDVVFFHWPTITSQYWFAIQLVQIYFVCLWCARTAPKAWNNHHQLLALDVEPMDVLVFFCLVYLDMMQSRLWFQTIISTSLHICYAQCALSLADGNFKASLAKTCSTLNIIKHWAYYRDE